MARSKKRKTKATASGTKDKRALVKKWAIPVVLAGALPAVALVSGAFGEGPSINYEDVLLLDDDHLLLVGSSGSDVDINRFSRVAYMGPNGAISWVTDDEGAVSLIGIGREVIWVDNHKQGIHARRMGDLSPIPETMGKVENHAALKVKRRALGISGERVVLDGMDGPYTLAPDGSLDKQAKDFEYAKLGFPGTLAPADLPMPAGCVAGDKRSQARVRALRDKFTELLFVSCGRRRGFVTFDDPPGKLITDTVYTAESRTRRLGRIDDEGELLWGTTVVELVDGAPFEQELGVVTIAWAGLWAGELRALVQNVNRDRVQYDGESEDYETIEHRLVVVDAKTGKPTSATAVVMPES